MRKLRVGLIGLGEVAQITHLPILYTLADKYEVKAICDISARLLETIGEKYHINGRYTTAQQMVEEEELDVVFVLNSDEYHAECAILAAKKGMHVFIEKPVCLTMREVDQIIQARDENGIQMFVGYMRRYAPAFTQALKQIKEMGPIKFVHVRDIIGANRLIIEQSSVVYRFDDISEEAKADRNKRAQEMAKEVLGEVPPELINAFRLLCGLSSHDLSAMRELIGMPNRVIGASQWNNGRYITAIFEYDDFHASFETGVDKQRRFDASIEIFGETKQLLLKYDTPYIRHLPTTLHRKETIDDAFIESVERPTFKDPYTVELETLYDVITQGSQPKTTIEDYRQDLEIFQMIMDVLKKQV